MNATSKTRVVEVATQAPAAPNLLDRPQRHWLRRAMFQLHLWMGLFVAAYIVVVCVSGSAIVFRREIFRSLRERITVVPQGEKLSREALESALQRSYGGYRIVDLKAGSGADDISTVTLQKDADRVARIVDPYTGEDRGRPIDEIGDVMRWLGDLHGKLLIDHGGYQYNAWGGLVLGAISLTGMFVWWPGRGKVKRAITVRRGTGWRRFTFDLHSAMGFWLFLLIFMWGVTGTYFVYPDPFHDVVNYFAPIDPPASAAATTNAPPIEGQQGGPRRGRGPQTTGAKILRGFTAAHYGNFGGVLVKILWIILGLIPAALAVTGVMLWWNRKVSGWLRRRDRRASRAGLVA